MFHTAHIASVLAFSMVFVGHGFAASRDISGHFHNSGMTIRAAWPAPQRYVCLCSLLALELEEATHRRGSEVGRNIEVRLYEDLLLTITITGVEGQMCTFRVTKADGLSVKEGKVTFPRRIEKNGWASFYQLSRDTSEDRLLVTVTLEARRFDTRRIANQRPVTAVYAFPAILGQEDK
jgi:hypothetical protein